VTVDQLIAHEEIRQAIYRHFRAGDRMDAELVRTAMWDDGVFEGGPFEGPAGEHMAQMYSETMAPMFAATMHYMMNMLIDVRGDDAFVEMYGMPYHVVPPEGLVKAFGATRAAQLDRTRAHELWMGIRYSVRMERRQDVWKIAVLKLIVDWSKVAPYTGLTEGGVYDILSLRGTRDRTDPSYAWHP